jgi:methyl-accepting chemotaxis protein
MAANGRNNDMSTQIASTSEEQGVVAEEISRDVEQINAISHQTTVGA